MLWPLYYIGIYLMVAGIWISSLWKSKSKLWISGRQGWVNKLSLLGEKNAPRIWFHVASLGEFEQARPVIEKLKEKCPEMEIILTFFSPSGYTIRAGYPHAQVYYLPADLPGNAMKWLEIVRPDMAVFVKYDLWPGYLNVLAKLAIPRILISAHWVPGGRFSSHTMMLTSTMLKSFNRIFLQKGDYLKYFEGKGYTNLDVAGDTRIDRSLQLSGEAANRIPDRLHAIAPFDLIAGSTWPTDDKLLIEAIVRLKLRAIIAPHDVSEGSIRRLMQAIPVSSARLSAWNSSVPRPDIVVIDSIGLLSSMYSLGSIAYVGGGFKSGIHNILEPMAHGKPVIFGPAYTSFPEAVDMVSEGGAWSISNEQQLIETLIKLRVPGLCEESGKIALDYLHKNSGASEKITVYLLESIPCTESA